MDNNGPFGIDPEEFDRVVREAGEGLRDAFEKVGQFFNHLRRREPIRQKIQNVSNTDAHAANAGPPAALLRVYGDAIH